jgi:hypothetical protein
LAAVFAASIVHAGVNVNIGIPLPAPVVVVPAPPPPPAIVYPAPQPAMPVEQAPPQQDYGYADAAPPPQLQFAQPPEMAVVPSGQASVYVIPNTFGVYFYGNSWYRFYNGLWFQASVFSDPWVPITIGIVPQVILGVPPEYPMILPADYYRFPYGEFRSHWRDWDRGRYWQRQDWYRREMRGEIRRERLNHITRERERWGREAGHRPPGFMKHEPGQKGHFPGPANKPGDKFKPGKTGEMKGPKSIKPGEMKGPKSIKPGEMKGPKSIKPVKPVKPVMEKHVAPPHHVEPK